MSRTRADDFVHSLLILIGGLPAAVRVSRLAPVMIFFPPGGGGGGSCGSGVAVGGGRRMGSESARRCRQRGQEDTGGSGGGDRGGALSRAFGWCRLHPPLFLPPGKGELDIGAQVFPDTREEG